MGPAACKHRKRVQRAKREKQNNSAGTASAQSGSKKACVEDAEGISEPLPPLISSSATAQRQRYQDIFIIYVPN